MFAAKSINLT